MVIAQLDSVTPAQLGPFYGMLDDALAQLRVDEEVGGDGQGSGRVAVRRRERVAEVNL